MVRASSLISLRSSATDCSRPENHLLQEALEIDVQIAQMRAAGLIEAGLPGGARRESLQHRPHLELVFDQLDHEILLGAHVVRQCGQPLGQRQQVGRRRRPLLLAARQRSLEILQAVGGLLQQSADVGRNRLVAVHRERAAGKPGVGGKPVLQLVVKAVLRLAGLQVEKAEDERAGKTEERRAEGRTHPFERRFETAFEVVEDADHVLIGDREVADNVAHRRHGLEQTPERAEQAQEDQQADHVAREVAGLVEPRADAVEQAAQRDRRQGHAALPVRQHRRKWCQQTRLA